MSSGAEIFECVGNWFSLVPQQLQQRVCILTNVHSSFKVFRHSSFLSFRRHLKSRGLILFTTTQDLSVNWSHLAIDIDSLAIILALSVLGTIRAQFDLLLILHRLAMTPPAMPPGYNMTNASDFSSTFPNVNFAPPISQCQPSISLQAAESRKTKRQYVKKSTNVAPGVIPPTSPPQLSDLAFNIHG